MKAIRCLGLLVVVLLSACDAQDPPAPKPKVASEAVQQSSAKPAAQPPTVESPVAVARSPASEPDRAPVHDLTPNVPVVPVTAKGDAAPGKSSAAATTSQADGQARPPAKSAAEKKQAAAKKSVAASKKVVKETSLNNAKLDLSLPPELARELKPSAATAAKPGKRKAILPPMFGDKDGSPEQGPFELNGRLLSNEMQLQMRNDNRRDVEGAALDFKFKQ